MTAQITSRTRTSAMWSSCVVLSLLCRWNRARDDILEHGRAVVLSELQNDKVSAIAICSATLSQSEDVSLA